MMPPAMEPAMPSAWTSCVRFKPSAAPAPAAAPIAPNTAVGWKPDLCTAFGTTVLRRQMASAPTAMPAQDGGAIELLLLGERQHGGNDHGAGMHGAALEGVVEVLAVRGGAVDEGGAGGGERRGMRRWPSPGPGSGQAAQRGGDVVGRAGCDAEADDVDQQALAGLADGGRQSCRIDGADAIGELFGDGRCGGHLSCSAAGRRH